MHHILTYDRAIDQTSLMKELKKAGISFSPKDTFSYYLQLKSWAATKLEDIIWDILIDTDKIPTELAFMYNDIFVTSIGSGFWNNRGIPTPIFDAIGVLEMNKAKTKKQKKQTIQLHHAYTTISYIQRLKEHDYKSPYQLTRIGYFNIAPQIDKAHKILANLLDKDGLTPIGFDADDYHLRASIMYCNAKLAQLAAKYNASVVTNQDLEP